MFQESDGEGEVDDFSDAAYYLRDQLLPLTPDDATNLSNSQLAKSVQDLLDDQIDSLAKSVRMRKFLTEQKDVLPCAHENSVHTRRVLEILLTRLKISGKVCEKQGRGSCHFPNRKRQLSSENIRPTIFPDNLHY